jgi:hypothetical protein
MPWQYDEQRHRYRDTATGRFLSPSGHAEVRDDFVRRIAAYVLGNTRALTRGLLSLVDWEKRVRADLTHLHVATFAFGRGGRNAMTAADKRQVAGIVNEQARYLHQFAADIATRDLSPARIEARAAQYVMASTASAEAGKVAAYRDLVLPVMPGQGTACQANCRCSWTIIEEEDAWRCTWILHADESCPDCRDRAGRYNPLVVPRA